MRFACVGITQVEMSQIILEVRNSTRLCNFEYKLCKSTSNINGDVNSGSKAIAKKIEKYL
jgi:hypothetical protein